MTVALDAPLRALFDRVVAASADSPAPAGRAASASSAGEASLPGAAPDLESIGGALVELARDTEYLTAWLERLGDRSGSARMHVSAAGPRLTLVHRTEGQMSAVHDHGTWVAIAPITGLETHRRWRVRPPDGEAWALGLVAPPGLEGGGGVPRLPPPAGPDPGPPAG